MSNLPSVNNKLNNLIEVLINQSKNSLFYDGNVYEGSKILVKEVVDTLKVDRTSIWLYSKDKKSILCQQLYIKSENKFYQGSELFEIDFKPYFDALKDNPIIVADDAETHPATSCFTEVYLKLLGIKSMLDVPIIYKGELLGVICVETLTPRHWTKIEINFAQLLSSLYSFAYSVKESNSISKNFSEMNKFINEAALISKADSKGKIFYVNKKFTDVSGWSLEEVIGKDHNIVNSGAHKKDFWTEMYKTVVKDKKIWNSVVTNKTKNGNLYFVDTFIKADFDNDTDELIGFTSIRQDVSDIYKSLNEIDKKNIYLEHAAKIIRHDMHSGINTYIPRGISSLERRLTQEDIKKLNLEAPLKMLKEGLKHTQKVYRGVYDFTNLVKNDSSLNKTECDLKLIINDYLRSTAYKSQVLLNNNLPKINVNESLFCTAIDNLIRNGLKYNDSETKFVKIYFEKERERFNLNKNYIVIQDNGRGMNQEEFENLSRPYIRKENQKESGSGLGLNICIAILQEHGFSISCEKNEIGTKIKIKIN